MVWSGQNVKGEKQIWKWCALATITGRLCEGHVALRHTPWFKTKAIVCSGSRVTNSTVNETPWIC